jgi:microcystin-dependent protein
MAEQFLGEIRMFSFGYPPKNWALCNGQLLAIAQNQALFALLGTFYGGDGVRTFALPNLQSRMPVHFHPDSAPGGIGGEETHTLQAAEIPSHTHTLSGSSLGVGQTGPQNGLWPSNADGSPYAAANDGSVMSAAAVGSAGGQPHPNLPPYLTVSFAIALVGIFPSRN